MSPLRSVSLIFVLLYTFSSIQSVQAQGTENRKCYVCNGKEECKKGQSVVQECLFGEVCYKTYQKGKLPETASRRCESFDTSAGLAEDLKCKESKEDETFTEIYCRCDTDECNSMANDKPDEGGGGGDSGSGDGGKRKSSGSNMRVFSLWPLAALTLLLCSSTLG